MNDSYDKDASFVKDIEEVINRHSRENRSDTPDFILAAFMVDCLNSYERTVNANKKWHSKP